MHSALSAWTAPAPRSACEADRWAARQGRRARKAPGDPVQRPDPPSGDVRTYRPSPAPAMAAHLPQEPEKPLPVCLGTLGAGSPRSRPKLGGVFGCVEDAFENKTLQLGALGGGCRGPRAGEPCSGPLGDPEEPSEPGGDRRETHGLQQVVATGWRLWVTGPVRGVVGPGLKTSHTHVGRQLGRGPGASFQAPQLLRGVTRAHGRASLPARSSLGLGLLYPAFRPLQPPSAPWSRPLPPRFWVSGPPWALGSCVSVGLAVSFYLSVCLSNFSPPASSFMRALPLEKTRREGGDSTMGPWGQCATRPRPPSKDLSFGPRHLPGRSLAPGAPGPGFDIGFHTRGLGCLGSPGSWHWALSRPSDFA